MEHNFENTNLTFHGVGMDPNGNKVARLSFPNKPKFSIQTNQNLPLTHGLHPSDIKHMKPMDIAKIQPEVIEHIKKYEPNQAKNLHEYKKSTEEKTYESLFAKEVEAQDMITEGFTPEMIEKLKQEYSKIERAQPESLDMFHTLFKKMDDEQLEQLAKANIKFLSKLTVNELMRRGVDVTKVVSKKINETLDDEPNVYHGIEGTEQTARGDFRFDVSKLEGKNHYASYVYKGDELIGRAYIAGPRAKAQWANSSKVPLPVMSQVEAGLRKVALDHTKAVKESLDDSEGMESMQISPVAIFPISKERIDLVGKIMKVFTKVEKNKEKEPMEHTKMVAQIRTFLHPQFEFYSSGELRDRLMTRNMAVIEIKSLAKALGIKVGGNEDVKGETPYNGPLKESSKKITDAQMKVVKPEWDKMQAFLNDTDAKLKKDSVDLDGLSPEDKQSFEKATGHTDSKNLRLKIQLSGSRMKGFIEAWDGGVLVWTSETAYPYSIAREIIGKSLGEPIVEVPLKEAYKKMRPIKIIYANGESQETQINGDEDTVLDYYLGKDRKGKMFNVGDGPRDRMLKVTSVEFLDDEEKKPVKESKDMKLSDVLEATEPNEEIQIGDSVKPRMSLKRPKSVWTKPFRDDVKKGLSMEVFSFDKLDGEKVLLLGDENDYTVVYPDEVVLDKRFDLKESRFDNANTSIKPKTYVKIDLKKATEGTLPAHAKLIRQCVVDGKVYVTDVSFGGSVADVAQSPEDAMLGTARVPTSSLSVDAIKGKQHLKGLKESVDTKMYVFLGHISNPDISSDSNSETHGKAGYWQEGNPDAKKEWVVVKDLKDAKEKVLDYIKTNGLGSGNWGPHEGEVKVLGKVSARFSYNGRLWQKSDGKEVDVSSGKVLKENHEALQGGLADEMSLDDVAAKHGIDIEKMQVEYAKGVAVESEHTDDPGIAGEIALDHLYEDPDYYTKLAKMEKKD